MKLNEIMQSKKSATFSKVTDFRKWHNGNYSDIVQYDETEINGQLVGYLSDADNNILGMWYNSKEMGTISLDFAKISKFGAKDPVAYAEADPHWPYD